MKSLHKLVLSSSLTAIGLLGLQGSAMALVSTNANICQIVDLSPGPGIFRDSRGITNFAASQRSVHCPIVRIGPAPAGGFSVFVDGSVAAGTSLTCQLTSTNFNNTFLGLASLFINTPGNFDRLLTLPQSQVPMFSHQVLSCSMPPNSSLFDIQPTMP
jgi:hypothetical protein